MISKKYLPLLALFVLPASNAVAGFMHQATAIVGNTDGEVAGFDVEHLIDQSGLSSSYTSGVTDFDSYVATTTHNNQNSAKWKSAVGGSAGRSGVITFDLGQIITLDKVAIWQDTHRFSQDFRTVVLRINDDGNFGTGSTSIGTFTLGNIEPLANVVSFASVSGRFVELQYTNYGSGFGATAREVAFSSASSPVPEPTSLAIFGLGAIGLIGHRRRTARLAA